ncbi:MAG: flagellar motor protein MotB [Pseudomonadota bacterium]
MSARAPHGSNQPPKIIVKKIYIEGGGGHHGGAWKVAYADFVTAMMAFFLLLWILGATTEKQRKGIADYFAPTLIDTKTLGIGGSGVLGGESVRSKHKIGAQAARTLAPPIVATSGAGEGTDAATVKPVDAKRRAALNAEDQKNFEKLRRSVAQRMAKANLSKLSKHVRFVRTRDGMRIDLIDDADYSMFASGTTALAGDASALIGLVAQSTADLSNPIMIRGHTDSVPYGDPLAMNNWMLSSGRAEATRRRLAQGGIAEGRFERIEGVAEREPMVAGNPADPRNRRVAITLLYRRGTFGR